MKYLIFVILVSVAFANEKLNNQFLNYVNGAVIENKQKVYVPTKNQKVEKATTMLIKQYQKSDTTISSASQISLSYNPKNNVNKSNTIVSNNNVTSTANGINNAFYLTGYCKFDNDIQIARLSAQAYIRCNFDKGNGELALLLVPDIYSKALIGQPLYVIFDNVPNKRYYVLGGAILNAQRTSINIASIVNDRKIERFLAKTGIDSANIVTQNALAYLQAKEKANTQTSVTYIKDSNGNTIPVQSQTTQPPSLGSYLTITTAQLISNVIKNMSDIFYEDLPYFFYLKGNTMVFVDLYVTPDVKGLPSINKPGNNLVIKNPPYSKENPTSVNFNPVTIKGRK